MKITDAYDAALEGNYDEFLKRFDGDVTQVEPSTHFNLLMAAAAQESSAEDRLKIMKYLLDHGIDVNFTDKKQSAMHCICYTITAMKGIVRIFCFEQPKCW